MVEGSRRAPPRPVVVLGLALGLGVLISVVAVLPGVRATPGFIPWVDGWVKGATYLLIAGVVLLRPALDHGSRPAWTWLATGYLLHALGFAFWLGWVRWQSPVPVPSVADAAWLLSAPAFLAGLVLLVRDRWARRSRAVLLDSLAAAAVTAGIALAVLQPALPSAGQELRPAVLVALAYPLLNMAQVVVVAALLAGLAATRGSPAVAWLAVSVVGMAGVDIVFAVQTVAGTFRPASLLSGVAVALTAAGAVAAWVPDRSTAASDPTALPGLGVPTLIGVAALGLLLAGSVLEMALMSSLLGLGGVVLLGARIALTFRVAEEVGTLRRAQRVAGFGSWEAPAPSPGEPLTEPIGALLGLVPSTSTVDERLLGGSVVEEDAGAVVAARQAGTENGRVDVTYRIVQQDGQVRTVHVQAEVERSRHARQDRWVGTLQDVTEERRLAAALSASEAMLNRVLGATNDGWWTVDLTTGGSLVSDRWWELHGLDPAELDAGEAPWRRVTDAEVARAFEAQLAAAQADQAPSLVVTLSTHDRGGRALPILLRVLLEYGDAGTPVRVSAAATDLTEVRQAEAAKDALLAAVSHELRTPLTPIVGFSELLVRSRALSGTQLEAVRAIERNAAHLVLLVDSLLSSSGARRAPAQPELRPVELTALVRTLVADRGSPGIAVALPEGPARVWADPLHLVQVLTNLLENAERHGAPPVGVQLAPHLDEWHVTVWDHGPGVPEWFVPRMFDDFSQATLGDQRPSLGLGLGLAIADRLASANHGRVLYRRVEDRTEFVLVLPAGWPANGDGPTSDVDSATG